MSLPVSFRRAARAEFDETALWYEDRQIGLGLQFVQEVEHAIELASTNPQRFALTHATVRRVQVRRFPYLIYYVHEPTRIVVVAVFHARRDPTIWQQRA